MFKVLQIDRHDKNWGRNLKPQTLNLKLVFAFDEEKRQLLQGFLSRR
jgi:hypothetical protein